MKMFHWQFPRRVDVSGLPYGFWFGWRPREPNEQGRFQPLIFRWHFGVYVYPRGSFYGMTWRHSIPRIHFGGRGPISA